MNKCYGCENTGNNEEFVVKEMMFGCGDTFPYFECSQCGLLQIKEVPADLEKYYPSNYYAFAKQSRLKVYLKGKRAAHATGRRNPLGFLITKKLGPFEPASWLSRAGVDRSSKILDVGCGQGALLRELQGAGFKHLYGLEPNVSESRESGAVRILNSRIGELNEKFDFIMFNHSLEHMPDPREVVSEIPKALNPGATVLVRIPIVGKAWEKYKANWVQIDAPRHLYLFSKESITKLFNESGFQLVHTDYDSTSFQFWGSEQNAMDIPLESERSFLRNPKLFPPNLMAEFENQTQEVNRSGEADQACFYFKL